MSAEFSQSELEAYLDEALQSDQMARIEDAMRDDEELVQKMSLINSRRDAGVHSLGGIWRRNRLSCPDRDMLGSFLLGVLDNEEAEYLTFHFETVKCRYCQANLEDMKNQQSDGQRDTQTRRTRYFQSSAGYLKR